MRVDFVKKNEVIKNVFLHLPVKVKNPTTAAALGPDAFSPEIRKSKEINLLQTEQSLNLIFTTASSRSSEEVVIVPTSATPYSAFYRDF